MSDLERYLSERKKFVLRYVLERCWSKRDVCLREISVLERYLCTMFMRCSSKSTLTNLRHKVFTNPYRGITGPQREKNDKL